MPSELLSSPSVLPPPPLPHWAAAWNSSLTDALNGDGPGDPLTPEEEENNGGQWGGGNKAQTATTMAGANDKRSERNKNKSTEPAIQVQLRENPAPAPIKPHAASIHTGTDSDCMSSVHSSSSTANTGHFGFPSPTVAPLGGVDLSHCSAVSPISRSAASPIMAEVDTHKRDADQPINNKANQHHHTAPLKTENMSLLESMREMSLDDLDDDLCDSAHAAADAANSPPPVVPTAAAAPAAVSPASPIADSPKQHGWILSMDEDEEEENEPAAVPALMTHQIQQPTQIPTPTQPAPHEPIEPIKPIEPSDDVNSSTDSIDAHPGAFDGEVDFMHDLSIDTLAQLHGHQNWTPFVVRHRGRGAFGSGDMSVPSSARRPATDHDANQIAESFTTPQRRRHQTRANRHSRTQSQNEFEQRDFDIDLSAIAPAKSHLRSSPTVGSGEFDLSFSPDPTPSRLPHHHRCDSAQSDSPHAASPTPAPAALESFGPFTLPTEEECQEFFRTRNARHDATDNDFLSNAASPTRPTTDRPIQLYDPARDQVIEPDNHTQHAHVHAAGVGPNDGGGSGDDEDAPDSAASAQPQRPESQPSPSPAFDASSPIHRGDHHAPFGSPCSPLRLAPADGGFGSTHSTALVQIDADHSFSLSPAPKANPHATHTGAGMHDTHAMRTPIRPVGSSSSASSRPADHLLHPTPTWSSTRTPAQQAREKLMQPISILKTPTANVDRHTLAHDEPFGSILLSPIAPFDGAAAPLRFAHASAILASSSSPPSLSHAHPMAAPSHATAAMAKVVRFDVPPSNNTTIESFAPTREEPTIQVAHTNSPQTHPPPHSQQSVDVSTHALRIDSTLPLAHELSLFEPNATLAEPATRSFHCEARESDFVVHLEPFVLAPANGAHTHAAYFTTGINEADAEAIRIHTNTHNTSSMNHNNLTAMSKTMNSFFEPFEAIDQTRSEESQPDTNSPNDPRDVSMNRSTASNNSSSSSSHSASQRSMFQIVVDAPVEAASKDGFGPLSNVTGALPSNASPNVSRILESSFHSSEEDDESIRVHTVPAPSSPSHAVSASSSTPAFLRVPTRRGGRSPAGGSSSAPTHRVSITRAHTNSAKTIRIRAHHHRKQRDQLTGAKKRSMRIFPSASELNRTLTFDSTTSSIEDAQTHTAMQATSNNPPHPTIIAASRSPIARQQQWQQADRLPQHVAPSASPSRKQLDFSEERLRADELFESPRGFDSFQQDHGSFLSNGSFSSRINLSETFDQITVLAASPTEPILASPARGTMKSQSNEQRHQTPQHDRTATPPFPSFALSPLSASYQYGLYESVAPLALDELAPPSAPAPAPAHPTSPTQPTLYAQRVIQGKLHAHFHPHTIDALQARMRHQQHRTPTRSTATPTVTPTIAANRHIHTSVDEPTPVFASPSMYAGGFGAHASAPTPMMPHRDSQADPMPSTAFGQHAYQPTPNGFMQPMMFAPAHTSHIASPSMMMSLQPMYVQVPMLMYMPMPLTAPMTTHATPATATAGAGAQPIILMTPQFAAPMTHAHATPADPLAMKMPVASFGSPRPVSMPAHFSSPSLSVSPSLASPRLPFALSPVSTSSLSSASAGPGMTVAIGVADPLAPSPSMTAARHRLRMALAGK